MRRYLRLYAYFLRFSFSRAMEFRFDFFFRIVMDLVWYVMHLVFFRVLFKDAEGNLTGKSWQAHGIGYDRRIPAKGKDSETYRIPLPGRGDYQVTSRLMYRSMTQDSLDEILKRTGQALPPVVSVEMASAQTSVSF